MARPGYFDARRTSFRASAPGLVGFLGVAFLRGGITASEPRAAIVSWHHRPRRRSRNQSLRLPGRGCVSCAKCAAWGHPLPGSVSRSDVPRGDQQIQRTRAATERDSHVQLSWRRHSVLKSGTAQPRPACRSRFCTKPAVCLSGIPNSTFRVRQVWIAAPLNWHRRPRLPAGGGVQVILGSNQMVRDPRCFQGANWADAANSPRRARMAVLRDRGRSPGRAWTSIERDFAAVAFSDVCRRRICSQMRPAHRCVAANEVRVVIQSFVDAEFSNRLFAGLPHLNWSTARFRKRRTENGELATQARGNSSKAAAG